MHPVSRDEFQHYLVSIVIYLVNEYRLFKKVLDIVYIIHSQTLIKYTKGTSLSIQRPPRLSLQDFQGYSSASKPTYNHAAIRDDAREKIQEVYKRKRQPRAHHAYNFNVFSICIVSRCQQKSVAPGGPGLDGAAGENFEIRLSDLLQMD